MTEPSGSIEFKQKGLVGGADFSTGKDLCIEVGIDVSDALKGLKAVERQAKRAKRALKDIEGLTPNITLLDELSDEDLFESLVHRGWQVDREILSTTDGTIVLGNANFKKSFTTKQ